MIYRFLHDGAGSVVAEDKIDALDPFLHHRYPAADIPKQARALYLQNLIRVIPDANYTPAPLVPALNPQTNAPLDMSECALRSVSPIHLQYLRNMGVRASMSVSIVVDGALWGLIAFHHTSPKLVPYELREVCKHVGQLLSQQVKAREQDELHHERLGLAAAREELVDDLSKVGAIEQALLERTGELRRVLRADGVAVLFGDRVSSTGHAPTEDQNPGACQLASQHGALRPVRNQQPRPPARSRGGVRGRGKRSSGDGGISRRAAHAALVSSSNSWKRSTGPGTLIKRPSWERRSARSRRASHSRSGRRSFTINLDLGPPPRQMPRAGWDERCLDCCSSRG